MVKACETRFFEKTGFPKFFEKTGFLNRLGMGNCQ